MKYEKPLNKIITIMAVLGFFIFIGAVGNSDYYTEIGQYYSLSRTIRQMLFGLLLWLPAFLREVK